MPTPYAAELRERVHELSRDVLGVLRPHVSQLDLVSLERTFTIRANEGFVAALSVPLVAAIMEAAPRVRLRFAAKPDKDARPLREGQIDLEIGVLGAFAPEVRTQSLFRSRFVEWPGLGIRFFRARTFRLKTTQHAVMLLLQGKANSLDPLTPPLQSLGYNGQCPL